MKVQHRGDPCRKLCHARVGALVQFVDFERKAAGPVYMVCALTDESKRAARPGMSHGLYDDERRLFLVDVETGYTAEIKSLSSQCVVYDRAVVTLDPA